MLLTTFLHSIGWADFFEGNSENVYNNAPITNSGSVFVDNVYFYNYRPLGCIRINSDVKILISESTFINSSSTESGGSLYFNNGNIQLVHYRVCSFNSSVPTNQNGNHLSCVTRDSNSIKIFESSISFTNGRHPCDIRYGNKSISYINMSNTQTIGTTAIMYLQRPAELNFSIFNNHSSSYQCFILKENTSIISKCIFSQNSAERLAYLTEAQSLLVKECAFYNNNFIYLTYYDRTEPSIIFESCKFDETTTIQTGDATLEDINNDLNIIFDLKQKLKCEPTVIVKTNPDFVYQMSYLLRRK